MDPEMPNNMMSFNGGTLRDSHVELVLDSADPMMDQTNPDTVIKRYMINCTDVPGPKPHLHILFFFLGVVRGC